MQIDYDTLFYSVDNFCKSFEPWYKKKLMCNGKCKRRNCCSQLTLSEITTTIVAYHNSGMSCFKYFYHDLYQYKRSLFPKLVHYERFVILIKKVSSVLIYLFKSLSGQISQYLFIDSTPMAVCHNRGENRHKVFKDFGAAKGKNSAGFFFGYKLHMLFNMKGQIVKLVITPGNTDDRSPVRNMLKNIKTKLIADKGYISQSLLNDLFNSGTILITKVKKYAK